MKDIIKAIIKEPGEQWGRVDWVPNSLRCLQDMVDGRIEAVPIGQGVVIICNEEGRLQGLPYNCRIPAGVPTAIDFVGTIIAVGENGEEFEDVPLTLGEWKDLYLGRK